MRSIVDTALGLRQVAEGPACGLWIAARQADPTMACGTYESIVQNAIVEALNAGDVFYDVGANIGFFSLIAARCVGPSGRVFAFEPVERNIAALRRAIWRNQVRTIQLSSVAVSSSSGVDYLNVAHHIGGATLDGFGVPPDLRRRDLVRTISIDDGISTCGWRPPTLVKIDVEGAELGVLRGMVGTISRHRPHLLIEVDDATEAGLLRKLSDVRGFVEGLGYVARDLASSYQGIDWHVAHVCCYPLSTGRRR
jgi:FkbM family methyltransferase